MTDLRWTVETCLYPIRRIEASVEVLLALSRMGSSAGKWIPIGSAVPATSSIREQIERDLGDRELYGASIRLCGLVTELAPQWRETLVLYAADGSWDFSPPPDSFASEYRWLTVREIGLLPMPQADSRFDYSFLASPALMYEATIRFDTNGILQVVDAVTY